MNHSPEPWIVESYQGDTLIRNKNPYEFLIWIAEVSKRPNERDNAKRIVDCVNACKGIEEPAKELAKLKSDLALTESILKRIMEFCENQHCPCHKDEQVCGCLICGTKHEILEIPFHVKRQAKSMEPTQ